MLLSIPYEKPLLEAELLGRYDRFIADVRLKSGEVVKTHCVNPGRMEGLVIKGAKVWVSGVPPESKRKLRYTWELIEVEGRIIGANTNVPNGIVKKLLEAKVLRGFTRYDELVPERPYGTRSRVDFWLRTGNKQHFLEVKNCHLVYPDGRGYFPDSVSERATKHLRELVECVEEGHKASVLFTVQDGIAKAMRPSDAHDPTFGEAVRWAHDKGVRFRALRIQPTTTTFDVEEFIPVDVKPYATKRMLGWRADANETSGWKRRKMRAPGKKK